MRSQDRDYTGHSTSAPLERESSLGTRLLTAGLVIAVAGATIWFLRGFRSVPSSPSGEGSLVVNINAATHEQLETVPGIGPSLGARIVSGRPYQSVDDLLKVSGIGPQTLERMRPFLKIDGKTVPR